MIEQKPSDYYIEDGGQTKFILNNITMVTNTISHITKKGIYLLCYEYLQKEFEKNLLSFFKCKEKPSHDPRYRNMIDDWHKHRIANSDWDNDWFLYDSRLNLSNISD